jgi:hypothetical protein
MPTELKTEGRGGGEVEFWWRGRGRRREVEGQVVREDENGDVVGNWSEAGEGGRRGKGHSDHDFPFLAAENGA